jgi:hypothetical protein
MNLDSNNVQKTMQSFLTNVTPKLLTTPPPDISNITSFIEKDELKHKKTDELKHKKKDELKHEKKIHPSSHIEALANDLYDAMNAANVELTAEKNAGCFKHQENTIYVESQIPDPETFSDKYLSREMREYIKHNSKKILTFECKINQRVIRVFFILFKQHCSEESILYYKTYAHRVFMWLHMTSLHSNCVESLNIYIYLTPFKKELPQNKSEVIGPIHANTGYTYRCEKKNEIVIYRQEEWFKVFIHETMHAFGNDFDIDTLDNDNNSTKYLKKIFSLPQDIEIRMSETYSEIWARIMNVAFQTYFKSPPSLESQTVTEFKKNFEFYFNLESVFSLYQCIKILDFMGVNYQVLVGESERSKKMMRSFYRENTHVFAYYVLTSILLHNNGNDFFSWCIKKNGSGLNVFKVKATQHEFIQLIASCYKKNDLLQKIVETETKVARDFENASASKFDDQLITTLRMTIIGFD